MKRHAVLITKIVVLAAVLVAIAFFISDSSHHFKRPEYQASDPTGAKYVKMVRWISPSSQFDVVVDIWQLNEEASLKDKLVALAGGLDGASADFMSTLLARPGVVGMLMIVGDLGIGKSSPMFSMVAQGDFDERVLIHSVRSIMKEGNLGLEERAFGDRTIFVERGEGEPFAFMFLDSEHLAIGSEASLKTLFQDVPARVAISDDVSDSLIIGQLKIGERLKAMLPPDLNGLSEVTIRSRQGRRIVANIHCTDEKYAMDVKMFLEGIRSLLMLQNSGNMPLVDMLGSVTIENRGSDVILSANLLSLLDPVTMNRNLLDRRLPSDQE